MPPGLPSDTATHSRPARNKRPRRYTPAHKKPQSSRLPRFLFNIAVVAGITLGALLVGASEWIWGEFGPITVPQALDNLSGGGEGVPASFYWSIAKLVVAPTAAAFGISIALLVLAASLKKKGKQFWYRFVNAQLTVACVVIAATGTIFIDQSLSIRKWLFHQPMDADIADYYVQPEILQAVAGDKNLVLIFLESMDDAFGDENLVEGNALEALQESTTDWARIDNLTQYAGGGWSQAGMVSSLCGVPIRAAGENTVAEKWQIAEGDENYMPGVQCLSDLLADAGYTQVFMSGGDLAFANSRNFLESHGFDKILELRDWEQLGETEIKGWGLSDKRLFHYVEAQLLELRDTSQPFMLSFATLDNHLPTPHFPYCPDTYSDETLSAIKCQSDMLAEMLTFMKNEGLLENTVVAMVADHRILQAYPIASYRSTLDIDPDSVPLFNRFYSPGGELAFARNQGSQLDLFPTLFEMLGGKLQDGRAGLGVSFFTPEEAVRRQKTLLPLSWEEQLDVLDSESREWVEEIWTTPSD